MSPSSRAGWTFLQESSHRRIICPACRALGYTTDCVERINHAQDEPRTEPDVKTNQDDTLQDPEYADLEVVIRFPVPVEVDEQTLMSKAQDLRDRLTENPRELSGLIYEVGEDYDVQVYTPTEHG